MRCEGMRRRGNAFTLGPVRWRQCENDAVVILKVRQEVIAEFPACLVCWNEAVERQMEIHSACPTDVIAKAEGRS